MSSESALLLNYTVRATRSGLSPVLKMAAFFLHFVQVTSAQNTGV